MRLSSASLGHLLWRSSATAVIHCNVRRPSAATVRSPIATVRSSPVTVIHCGGHLQRSSTTAVESIPGRPPPLPSYSCTILYHPQTCTYSCHQQYNNTYPWGHTRGDEHTKGHKRRGHIYGEDIHVKERLLEHLMCVWN